jgi:hypothetical protein
MKLVHFQQPSRKKYLCLFSFNFNEQKKQIYYLIIYLQKPKSNYSTTNLKEYNQVDV